MTDFLQRVSLMALGLSPAVQPLVVSRYAPDSHLPAPEPLPGEEPPFAGSAEHASQPDTQSLSPSRPSLTTEPVVRRAPEQTAANSAQHQSMEPLSQASGTTNAAQSTGVSGSGAIPFYEPASPTRAPLNTAALIEPEKNAVTGPTEEESARVTPTRAVAEPWSAPTVYAESQPPPDIERRDIERMDVRDAPLRRPDAVSAPAAAHQGADTFSANESAPPAPVNERSAQARHSLGSEPIGRRHSAEDSFTQRMGFEHELQSGAMSEPELPRSNDANSFVRATASRADAQSLPSQYDRAADTPSGHVIRVTIGRIEVRAVPPPPLPSVEAVATPTPKLSLDEYLRQHNGRSQ